MHPEQRLGIVFPLRVLYRPLMLQKRRTLPEKHRERTQPRIHQRVVGILPSPSVGKCFKDRAQLLRNSAEGQYIGTKGNAHGSTYRLLDPPTLAPQSQNENCCLSVVFDPSGSGACTFGLSSAGS